MKKFFKRLTDKQFMMLWFIPFGVGSFYFHGVPGFIGAVIGWYLGGVLWKNQKAILNYNYKKFFRKYAVAIINLLILIPVDVAAYHLGGWSICAAVTVGWLSGMIIWRLRKGRW